MTALRMVSTRAEYSISSGAGELETPWPSDVYLHTLEDSGPNGVFVFYPQKPFKAARVEMKQSKPFSAVNLSQRNGPGGLGNVL